MRTLYSIAIAFFALGVRLAAPFNGKAAQLRKGWRHWVRRFPAEKIQGHPTAWFHAASLGEFEQARPVIEAFRQQHPDFKICLSFFSPSGYEIRKDYNGADIVFYLPPDTRANARRLVELIDPKVAFFVKYEFWFNYLHALKRHNTRTFIFSAIFRPNQYFFKWYGSWFTQHLKGFDHLFVQNEQSLQLLNGIGITQCSLAGDTRFDRVNDIARQAKKFPAVEAFLAHTDAPNAPVLMAGSSWEPDEANIKHFLDRCPKPIKTILAPHMIGEGHLAQIEHLFSPERCIRYSLLAAHPDTSLKGRDILIIDNIGMLSSLYRYADIAYIGGGFGKGIHNTLEAAIFNIPVCFGPNHKKFQEALGLLDAGAAKTYSRPDELVDILNLWVDNPEARQQAAAACRAFMQRNLGATKTIMDSITTL